MADYQNRYKEISTIHAKFYVTASYIQTCLMKELTHKNKNDRSKQVNNILIKSFTIF